MRIANNNGRAVLLTKSGPIDVNEASAGEFGPGPVAVLERWAEFRAWVDAEHAGTGSMSEADQAAWLGTVSELGAPSPRPRQVFAVGLNYRGHIAEAGMDLPGQPLVFTKYASCIVGGDQTTELPRGGVDWEVELAVVIGSHAYRIDEDQAWAVVAGLTVGQDLSERTLQHSGPAPQFGLGKSFPGFGPTGPVLVTPDELPDPNDLAIGCSINGEVVQQDRTGGMVFGVAALVSWLSQIVPLYPGDLIFTGTPSGVGATRTPPRFLEVGDELVSWIEGVGSIRSKFVGPRYAGPALV
ncbi:fumarylacetoacetate hydrolase family protein [Nocardia sienata]|uniref:fumarylacetoacetate hydrolase family protein n=1 Tax=Nocardia sienata TaxID=248552 RepID=UPI0007A38723|nr:fumarylacetoacetate hydrolase family protein [Nocardia sienata]